jgi:hypothetical protein
MEIYEMVLSAVSSCKHILEKSKVITGVKLEGYGHPRVAAMMLICGLFELEARIFPARLGLVFHIRTTSAQMLSIDIFSQESNEI